MMEIIKVCSGAISAIGMLGIAVIVACIAYMQYKVNRERHRFELFNRRISIYGDLKSFILDIILIDNFLTEENLKKIYRMNDEAVFLFGDDITRYINEIKEKTSSFNRKVGELSVNIRELKVSLGGKPLSDHKVAQLKLDIDTLKLWFDEQLEILPKKFSKYLKFEIEKKGVLFKLLNMIHCKS